MTDFTLGFRPLSIIMRFNTKVIKKNEMKTYRFYIMTLALSFLFAGCSEDELTKGPGAQVGDDVQFGLSLSNLDTRTVYGEETSTGFPIYWVNGDKVRVASPQCLSGRNSAEYQIAVDGATQNYASSMTKTGDAGVQWGDAATADFYSIYPSSASTKLEVSGTGVTTKLHVDATQFASTSTKNNGTSDYFYAQPAEMGNVVMYAKKAGVTSGSTVELHYTPFSTVLEFEINASNEVVAGKQKEITIQSLTLTAPTGTTIAGDFAFNFDGPSITPAATGGSNSITMHFLDNNQYTTVLSTTKTTLKAKMCLMPISGNLAGWKIEVNTSAGTFAKTLTEKDKDGKKTDLVAGQVHKIKLPKLNYASDEWVYSLDSWIPTLPDYTNIYLSELSLPGAWYAGSKESYQATSSITDLWNAGVRAFAVECRTNSKLSGIYWNPNYVCISGSGSNNPATGAYRDGKNITTVLESIKNALKSHQDEYAVLVLSYADGGDGGHRAKDHAYFLEGVANALSGYSDIVYSRSITKNTTIADVKGKLIVKVNVDNNITIGNYTAANALISYNPFLSQIDAATYEHPYYSDLYWNGWADANKTCAQVSTLTGISATEAASKFIWVFSSANRTQVNTGTNKTIPTYKNRQDALGAMMNFSKTVYDKSHHNVWFYFNCGGTQATSSTSGSTSPTDFAKTMNSWLLSTINAKTDASPLGIVMFNQCTNTAYNGPAIIDEIIKMNSKFYLKHAGTNTDDTGGSTEQTAAVTSAAPGFDSGMEDSGKNAINWE